MTVTAPKPNRERQVLDAAARGLSIGETGAELHLSPDTVRTYRKRILRRYDARNITHAVALWTSGRIEA